MNKLSSSEKMLLYILLLVATCVVCIWFVLVPTIQSYQDLGVQLEAAKQQEADVQAKLAEGLGLQEKINEMLEKAEIEKTPFLTIENKEILQRWIVNQAQVSGLQVKELIISDRSIESVEPYSMEEKDESYAIGEYYSKAVNQTTETVTTETATTEPATSAEGEEVTEPEDRVIKNIISVNVVGGRENVISFINTLSTQNKHIIVDQVPFSKFNANEPSNVIVNMTLYSIHKENDGMFDSYRF